MRSVIKAGMSAAPLVPVQPVEQRLLPTSLIQTLEKFRTVDRAVVGKDPYERLIGNSRTKATRGF